MKAKKESIILSIILFCLVLIAVGMSYAFLKTSFFANKTSVLKVGSLSLILDESTGDAITVEDGTPMYDSEGMKQDNYFTFSLKNNGTLDSSYTIYLENQPLDEGDSRVNSNYVRYNLEKDNSVLQPYSLEGDQAIDKGIIRKKQTINYKMRLWLSSDIPQSEENKVFKAKLNVVGNQNTKMMARSLGLTNDEKKTVTKIVLQNSIKPIDNELKFWDISAAKNKTVMARMVPSIDDDTTNTLYIQSDKEIFTNYTCDIFQNFGSLKTIENIELLNTSAATNMGQMFMWCDNLESIDVSHFDTSNVTNMSLMFYANNKITNLDVSNFNTSKVTGMNMMFGNCNSLTSLDVSNFDTSNVDNMGYMFLGCKKLVILNLSNFNTSKVTNMIGMFNNCSSLTDLNVSNFDTSNVTNMSNMFSGCSQLTSLNVSNFDTSNVTNMQAMFQSCSSLTDLDLSKFDTSNVTDMNGMFQNCQSLTDLNVSNFNTSNVTNMCNMFRHCSGLTSLNVGNFDTSNVTDIGGMFANCNNLKNLNLNNFNTSNVTNMGFMFLGCTALTNIDVSEFNTSKVTSMVSMFHNCTSLARLDLGNFNISNVTSMENIFYGDVALTYINFKSADFSNVTSYNGMFFIVPSSIKIIVKDITAKDWLEDKLKGNGVITIA